MILLFGRSSVGVVFDPFTKLIRVHRNGLSWSFDVDKEEGYIDLSDVWSEDVAACEDRFNKAKVARCAPSRHGDDSFYLEDFCT
jgi:hypothetical protein